MKEMDAKPYGVWLRAESTYRPIGGFSGARQTRSAALVGSPPGSAADGLNGSVDRGGSAAKIPDFPELISQKVTDGRQTATIMVEDGISMRAAELEKENLFHFNEE